MRAWINNDVVIVAGILLLIAGAMSCFNVLPRVGNLIFDVGQSLFSPSPPEDLVIVAIDEESLGQIGRWPWPRSKHALLLNKICNAKPAVVGLDIAFSESSSVHDDSELAKEIAKCANVVLPIVIERSKVDGQLVETPPIFQIASAAAGLGHVSVRLDGDGMARSIDLRERLGASNWPLFAEEILRIAGRPSNYIPANSMTETASQEILLTQNNRFTLQYIGPPGAVSRISYASALDQVPPETFSGKIVLVGATAVGLGDFLPTPVSAHAQPMPGIEIQANVINALSTNRLVRDLPIWLAVLLCGGLALVPLIWLPKLMPLSGLVVSLTWSLLLCFVCTLLPVVFKLWFAPTGAVVAGFLAYPLWSWRRLEMARRHLDMELLQLRNSIPELASTSQLSERSPRFGFEQRITSIQKAQEKLLSLEKQRNDALAFISHDIRTPLAIVIQKLEGRPQNDPVMLLPLLRRAHLLAQEFVQLARAESLDQRSMETLDIAAIAHQAIDEIYDLALTRGLTLVRQLPEGPVWLPGDFGALERSLTNLIKNAITYSPRESEVRVGIDLSASYVKYWVENKGDIPANQQLRLFQRFSSGLHGEIDSMSTGLGLYYVRTVAEKHGGSVGMNASDGRLRFWIQLPREPVEPEE